MVYGEVFNFLFSFQFFILIKILFSSNAGQRGEVECQRFIIIANSTFELVRDGHLLKQRKVQNNVQCATNQAAQRKICVCVFGIRLSCFLFHLHTPTPTSRTHTHTVYWYRKKMCLKIFTGNSLLVCFTGKPGS